MKSRWMWKYRLDGATLRLGYHLGWWGLGFVVEGGTDLDDDGPGLAIYLYVGPLFLTWWTT